jgi:hypothetical protein
VKKLFIFLRFLSFLLTFSILFTGCHSFYSIPSDDYYDLEKMNVLKIVYKNGKEFVVEKNDTTQIKIVGDSLVVYQGAEKKVVGMNEIEQIKESRFDFGGTFSLIIGIPIAIVIITGLILWGLGTDFKQ